MAELDLQPIDLQPLDTADKSSPASSGLDLQPLDLQPIGPPQTAVQKEIRERGFFNKPTLGADYTKPEEIDEIAKRHGVDPGRLRDLAPYFGARFESDDYVNSEELKRGVGNLGQALLNLPQKAYKSLLADDKMEKALDEVQALTHGRQSYLQLGAELATPLGVGKPVTTLGKIAEGAAIGTAAGLGGSEQGKELGGALTGQVFGAATGALMAGILGKGGARGANEAGPEVQYLKSNEAKLEEGVEKILSRRTASEAELEKVVLEGKPVTQQMAETIVREQVPEERLATLLSRDTDEGQLMLQRAMKENRTVEQMIATDLASQRVRDIADRVAGEHVPGSIDDAYAAIRKYAEYQGGREAVAESAKDLSRFRAGQEYLRNEIGTVAPGTARFLQMGADALSDAQFVLRAIDEKMGTKFERIHQDLNSKYNQFTFTKAAAQDSLENIYQQARKAGLDEELRTGSKILDAIEAGTTSKLAPEEQKLAASISEYFETFRQRANSLAEHEGVTPLSIPQKENYIPHMLLNPTEAGAAFEKQVGLVLGEAEKKFGTPFTELSQLSGPQMRQLMADSPEMQQLLSGLKLFAPGEIRSSRELTNAVKEVLNVGEIYPKMETIANSAQERIGEIPRFLQETNLYKLMDRWANNTFRHVYLRRGLEQLRDGGKLLDQAGATREAGYLKRLVGDIAGIRSLSAGRSWVEMGVQFDRKIDQMVQKAGGLDSFSGQVIGAAKSIPLVLHDLNTQVHPNLLGLSLRATIMNSLQTLVKTVPELGASYGFGAVSRGAYNAALNFRKYAAQINREGLNPAAFTAAGRDAMAEGIQASMGYKLPKKAIDALSEFGMKAYEWVDKMNRIITLGTAEQMSGDLMKGSRAAFRSLGDLPTALQRDVVSSLHAGDQQAVSKAIAEHLNASTQYNYNRISMSEFGRILGPGLSTFSKWPTATVGEMLGEFRNRGLAGGLRRNTEKYFAPYLLLAGVGRLIHGSTDEMTDRQKKVFGSTGLGSASPLGGLEAIATGDFFTPPAVDALWSATMVPLIKSATGREEDTDRELGKLEKGVATTVQNFLPGSMLLRFLTDDLVTFSTGQRPEGNFFEKTAEGARRITRG